jgi:uncharacterized small protein (DUF1192 family)
MSFRITSLLVLATLATPALAQPTLSLVDPVVVVGGDRMTAAGDVYQPHFRFLDVIVTGIGRYAVSDRPFTGARRSGEFDGESLAFTVDGHSVRVRSAAPILDAPGVLPAYVRYHPAPAGERRGRRTVRFAASGIAATGATAGGVRATGRGISDDPRVQAEAERNARLGALDAERDRLEAELARARAERDAASAERTLRATQARPVPPPTQPPASAAPPGWAASPPTALAVERDALAEELARVRAERDALRARVGTTPPGASAAPATAGEVERLRAEVARAEAERRAAIRQRDSLRAEAARASSGARAVDGESARAADRAAADVMALRAELDLMSEELRRVRAERDAIRAGHTGAAPLDLPDRRTGPGYDEPGGRLAISHPDFDHARLMNVGEVRTAMAEALLRPGVLLGRSSGDVLVMFVTDTTGQVVQTELAEPLAPEVDIAAERIVRLMRITPPRVHGRSAVLRSQVRVRFSR